MNDEKLIEINSEAFVDESETVEIEEIEPEGIDETPLLAPAALLASLLFASPRPVSAERLGRAAKLSDESVSQAISEIKQLYRDEIHGFSLCEVASGFQFRTAPQAKAAVRRLLPPRIRRLSRAALETLAVVSYKQPVGRAEIESIRGVDAIPTLKTLLESDLIRIVGYQETPGQPALYGTTTKFLEQFGLRDLSELPSLREAERVMADPGEGEAKEELPSDASPVL